jgi:hypothetical protein
LFSRYQRNEKALVLALMEMYVEGVSTRKVKDVTEKLCGTSFSKSLVSSLAGRLDAELESWRSKSPDLGSGLPVNCPFCPAPLPPLVGGSGAANAGATVTTVMRLAGKSVGA